MNTIHKYTVIALLTLCLIACTQNVDKKQVTTSTNQPTNLLVEGMPNPINVHNSKATMSWHANVKQQFAYQIHVASSVENLENDIADLWDSGKVIEKASRNIVYDGALLNSKDSAFWRVRVWGKSKDTASKWSHISAWEMGLLTNADWQAKWIQTKQPSIANKTSELKHWIDLVGTVENEDGTLATPAKQKLYEMPTASIFKYQFTIDKKVIKAKLHSTAAGYYEIYINGARVDNRIMDPGQTDFNKRILYNTDMVHDLIAQNNNTITVHLGSGWYDENIAFSRWKNPDGEYSNRANGSYTYGQPSFIAQLEINYADGSSQVISSNEEWLSHPSPVLKEGLFSGEFYDANQAPNTWNIGEWGKDNWQPVKILDTWPTAKLEPQRLPPIKAIKKMLPIHIYAPREGVWVYDFGQNFTGIPTLNLEELALEPNQTIYLRYAEWADEKGNISQLSGGGWATHLNAVDAYQAAGDNQSTWTPSFTWHGFRYIEVIGLHSKPSLNALNAHLTRSDVERVGHFNSSDKLINRIHDTALWTYESNLMSVPLDCPIREKAGWTGDAHAALVTGNYNFNMETFWPKYLGDFLTSDNIAPTVVPGKRTGAEKIDWAVAEVFIAWEHFLHHGNSQILANQYQSLLEYMAFGESQMTDFLIEKGYGDWCDPVIATGTPRVGGRGTPQWTSTTVTSTALFTQAANYMSQIANQLNKSSDSAKFRQLYDNLRQGFHTALYDPVTEHYGSQTADAMALRFSITPVELRQKVADALHKDITEKWGGHSSVGALGQTWLYLALSDHGYTDTAFNIFKATGYPGFSYLFDNLNGTTLWERKGAFDPNKTKGPVRSLNHPFHSGYDGWFYQGLGGIRPMQDSVGFQEFMLKPVFPTALNSINVLYDSGYGQITSQWQRDNGNILWQVTIPNNTSAWVHLPDRPVQKYLAGKHEFVIDVTNNR